MTEHETQEEHLEVWPPAVALPNPVRPSPTKEVRLGRASIWAAGIGLGCWVCAIAALILNMSFILKGSFNNAAFRSAYFAGLACEVASIGFGIAGGKTRVGKVGLALGIFILGSMVAVTLADHYKSGGDWIWNGSYGVQNDEN